MEPINLIALAVPFFFALIGVELLVARWQGKRLYRTNDSLNDINCGILDQVLGVFSKTIVFGVYVVLYEWRHLFEIASSSPAAWIACFLGVDFLYYWFHRVSHESNLPWGAHVVHHQSEEFNLAVALRQGALQPLFGWVFYLPLALLGFPPVMFLVTKSINTLYQFWIHTRTIGKLGPLEWVLNTPSHHRVHHGCDEKYLDKNYAGALIVWDRLFGSFQEEEEEPTYGVTKQLASWNPVWANVDYYADLVRRGRDAPSFWGKVRLWLAPPAHTPDWSAASPRVDVATRPKYDATAPPGLISYAMVLFLTAIGLSLVLLFRETELGAAARVTLALLVVWSVVGVGGIFERKSWVVASELLRLAALWGAAVALVPAPPELRAAVVVVGALVAGGHAAWLLRHRRQLGILRLGFGQG